MNGRRKKCNPAEAQPRKKKKIREYQTIKMSLNRGLRSEIVNDPFKNAIENRVLIMTKCIILAALNIHCFLSHLLATESDDVVTEYFTQIIDKNFFKDFYRGVTWIGQDDEAIRNSGFKLHLPISHMCRRYNVTAPDLTGFGNIVQYAFQMYYTNFYNNIWMHARSRMKKFCKAHQNDKEIVKDTLHYLFYTTSDRTPDPNIIERIRTELRPIGFGDGKGYFFGMEKKWFKYVPLFMRLQG